MNTGRIKNGLFLTCVFQFDPEDIDLVQNMLDKLEYQSDNEWFQVGYKYIGPLQIECPEECNFDTSNWLSKILEGIHDSKNGVIEEVEAGVRQFTLDYKNGTCLQNVAALKKAIKNYLEKNISHYDRLLFSSLMCADNNGEYNHITPNDTWNIGVVNPWPGDMSAEAEVLARLKKSAEDAGFRLTMLSNFGHVLTDDTQKQTSEFIDAKELDFLISTHYDTHKCLDTYYYHTLWNPPEIPLSLDDYSGRVAENYLMNDDYLIYDEGGMSKHLQCILLNKERNLRSASSLMASFPESCILKPSLQEPKMFYCGMNWERVVSNSNRHEGLFKLLDQTGEVKFFGPEKVAAWGGLRPWEGYKCYQHEIPFDGFSILKEINECGICLVLSSDIHRRAGAATNRTYEACAAGAVIISDDNPFMLKHFHDAALFIKYNKNDPQDTFKQLMEKFNWIIDHKEEALSLALRSQRIFIDQFALDRQLKRLVNNHNCRVKTMQNELFAQDESKRVLITFVLNTLNNEDISKLLHPVVENVRNQHYSNIQLVIVADSSIVGDVRVFCQKCLYTIIVEEMELFDFKKSRRKSDCEALREIYKIFLHDYFINVRSEEVWFSDHITTLVRTIENTNALVAYSGRLFEDKLGFRRTDMFRKLTDSTIYNMNCPDWLPVPGQILFKASCHDYLPECMDPYLDGYEHYALLTIIKLKHKSEPEFSRRMTMNYKDGKWDERCSVIPESMQIRLIRDVVKYDITSSNLTSAVNMIHPEVMRMLAHLPVKKWMSMRMKRILLRVLPSQWSISKRISVKHDEQMSALINHFL